MKSKILFSLVLATSLLSPNIRAEEGGSGINASKSVSPLDFILPGLTQNCPPSPVLAIETRTVPWLAQTYHFPL